jgi:hypothetical protein
MPMVCSICSDSRRVKIDREIVRGRSVNSIATEYGFSPSSLGRHKAKCISRQLLKSHEMRELVNLDTLMGDVVMMRERCLDILERAKAKGWMNTELRALGEIRATYEFLGKLAIDLRRLENEEQQTQRSQEVQTLQENLSRDELELLQYMIQKANGQTA